MRETAFSIGLQGIHKDDVGHVQNIIWSTLETIAKYVCLSICQFGIYTVHKESALH